jgi:hypothetical protein
MACRGVHFALTAPEVATLKQKPDDASRLEYLQEQVEETYFSRYPELLAESDKSWDALHRLLADGELTYDGGAYPLNHVVLGGEILYGGDDYIISLKSPQQVQEIDRALDQLSEAEFRSRYFALRGGSYEGDVGEEDFEYTWNWFQNVRALFKRAAGENRFVLFSVDQ